MQCIRLNILERGTPWVSSILFFFSEKTQKRSDFCLFLDTLLESAQHFWGVYVVNVRMVDKSWIHEETEVFMSDFFDNFSKIWKIEIKKSLVRQHSCFGTRDWRILRNWDSNKNSYQSFFRKRSCYNKTYIS